MKQEETWKGKKLNINTMRTEIFIIRNLKIKFSILINMRSMKNLN